MTARILLISGNTRGHRPRLQYRLRILCERHGMRTFRRLVLFMVAGVWLTPSSVTAHHPIAAKFDESKRVTLDGTVSFVDWKNPHVHLFVDVRGQNRSERWTIELESRVDLVRSGWKPDTVRPGDVIKVEGFVARDGSLQAWG